MKLASTDASVNWQDVTVAVTHDRKTYTRTVTVFTPEEEVQLRVWNRRLSWPSPQNPILTGYSSWHYFQIRNQFGQPLTRNLELNERWGQVNHDRQPNSNWGQFLEDAWMIDPRRDIDYLEANFGPPKDPKTSWPLSPVGVDKVYNWKGEHFVGSLIKAKGVHVLTKKWQYFVDHGERQPWP